LQKNRSRAIAALDAARTVQGALNEEEEGQPSGLDTEKMTQGASEEGAGGGKPLAKGAREVIGNI
jgi:hypothetical protein